MNGGMIPRKMVLLIGAGVPEYQSKLSIKTEGNWRSHCNDRRLCKGCIEINGVG